MRVGDETRLRRLSDRTDVIGRITAVEHHPGEVWVQITWSGPAWLVFKDDEEMDIIDRAASDLIEASELNWNPFLHDPLDENDRLATEACKRPWRRRVLAVLQAIREPDDAMIDQMADDASWQAMIDSIIARVQEKV